MNLKKWKVFGGEYVDELDRRLLSNRILWFFTFLISFAVFLLTLSYFSLASKLEVNLTLPPYKKTLTISKDGASREFYELWGTYYLDAIRDFNKENVEKKLNVIISKMIPSTYYAYKPTLTKLVNDVKKNNLVFHFNATDEKKIITDKKKQRAKFYVKGFTKSSIAGQEQDAKECSIEFILNFIDGDVYVSSFKTNCF